VTIKIPKHTRMGQRKSARRKPSRGKDPPETAFDLCCVLLCQVHWGLAAGHLVLLSELA
jgi:hypothetical protein